MRTIVNYTWLQKPTDGQATIPPACFACFQNNAERHTDAQFILWVQNRDAYHPYVLPRNVRVRFVDKATLPEFEPFKGLDNFEAKIDMLRLIVLKESLRNHSDTVAVYADFDIPDLCLNTPQFRKRMQNYGAAFAGSYVPMSVKVISRRFLLPRRIFRMEYGKIVKSEFENGFLAFCGRQSPLLTAMIEQATADIVSPPTGVDRRDLVYFAMMRTIDLWARRPAVSQNAALPMNWRSEVGSFYVQYCSGWRLDDHPHLTPKIIGVLERLRKRLKRFNGRQIDPSPREAIRK